MSEKLTVTVFSEDFKNHTDENQPYSVKPEPTHKYTNADAYVADQALHIKRNQVKQLLIMPEVGAFDLSAELFYDKPPHLIRFDRWVWEVYFGYNRETRSGYKFSVTYVKKENAVEWAFFKVDGVDCREIVKKRISHMEITAEERYPLLLSHRNGVVTATVFGVTMSAEVAVQWGIIGFAKGSGLTDIGVAHIAVASEKPVTETVYTQSFTIPRTDGGHYDYDLQISVDRLGETHPVYEVRYELTGGVYNNHDNMQSCDVWCREHDFFWGLYFSLGRGRLYIHNGKLTFCDNSDCYTYFKEIVSGDDIPYGGKLTVEEFTIPDKVYIGYERRFSFCAGNLTSDRMFTYDACGQLLFAGKALDVPCFFEVSSDPHKEIVSRLPKNLVGYADAVFHAQKNHYFFSTETPTFRIDLYSKLSADYLAFEAELQTVYFEKLKDLSIEKIDAGENVFGDSGYKKYSFSVACDVHSQGVYHMEFRCRYGTDTVYKHTSAFEIFDEALEESPQETALLPTIYVGDGCAAYYPTYNLANQKPDFNIMHYINCCLEAPAPAEHRRAWELVHTYRRKLLVWMTKRGFLHRDDTYENYPGVSEHADYINYQYPGIEDSMTYYRYDLWKHAVFDVPGVRELYRAFLTENPDIRDEFPEFDEQGHVDEQRWAAISGESFDRLVRDINDKTEPLFEQQWAELQTINPHVKRFSYGPYHIYAVDNSGAYDTKWFGFSKEGLSRVFDGGFLQLEDYPFACGYQTHICAWNMMTIKQEWKDLRIAPELYDSFPDGCPDGATANAFPPASESFIEPYQIVTQMYEYLYNTPILENGKFRYWDDKILQVYEYISYEPEKRYACILRSWKIHLDHKPARPLKGTAFVTEFDCVDDGRTVAVDTNAIFNKCQTGMCVVHEVNAERGLPQGFVLKWDSLAQLDKTQTDILVLPSLRKVGAEIKAQIRKLYQDGVALIATGDVSGLEDIFGVVPCSVSEKISRINYNGESELVYPSVCYLPYAADRAASIVCAENNGIIFRNDRALLLNACLSEVGVDSYTAFRNAGRANISRVIRAAIGDFMHSVAAPLAHCGDQCGMELVETVSGETLAILTDYSPYSNEHPHTVSVWFDRMRVAAVENLSYDAHDIQLNCFARNGQIDGFSVMLRPREVLVFKLKTAAVDVL